MHEATKKLINYVRLRIDEEEEKWMLKVHEGQDKQRRVPAIEEVEGSVGSLLSSEEDVPIDQPVEEQTKAYVLLLHFPPSVSQRACYPAMFLYGWDYHYLDSLVASAECAIPLKSVHLLCIHVFANV